MLEPERIRWALPAGLLTFALLAASASATLADPAQDLLQALEAVPSVPEAQPALGDVAQAAGRAVERADGALAQAQGSAPSGPHQPGPGQAPVPEKAQDWAKRAIDPLRPLIPQDAVGYATEAARQATQLPQRILAPPAEPEEEPADAAPQAATVEAAPSALMPTVLLAAGAAATVTFLGFWLAGSSGAVAGPAAAAAKAGGELRRLLPWASPLFTRFERDTVLGHPRREALYALILQEPGISLQALGQATGLSRTAVIHHLRLMEQQHLVVSRRVGRSRHYFENGGRYGHDQKEAYAVLQNGRSKAVAEFIKGHPGAMQKSLCEALGIQPSIAHWHVRRLEEARIVETVRQGRTVAYFPGPGLRAMDPAVPARAPSPSA